MKVSIIAEGGPGMGIGHLKRAKNLSEELTRGGGIMVDWIPGFTEREVDTIVVDRKSGIEEKVVRDFREKLGLKVVLFDNISPIATKYADLVVNPTMGSGGLNRKFKKGNTLFLVGPRYQILGEEFYKLVGEEKPRHMTTRVLVTLGGSDPSNLTPVVIEKFLGSETVQAIDVVEGPYFEHPIQEIPGITVHRNLEDLSELMHQADFVITSPGISVFEALFLGAHVYAIPQNNWQETYFRDFGWFFHPKSAEVKKMEIGQGKQEVVDAILGDLE